MLKKISISLLIALTISANDTSVCQQKQIQQVTTKPNQDHIAINEALKGNFIVVGALVKNPKPDKIFLSLLNRYDFTLTTVTKYTPSYEKEKLILFVGSYENLEESNKVLPIAKKVLASDAKILREYFYKNYKWDNNNIIESPKYYIQMGMYEAKSKQSIEIQEKIKQSNLPLIFVEQYYENLTKLHEIILLGEYNNKIDAQNALKKAQLINPNATILSEKNPASLEVPQTQEVNSNIDFFQEGMKLYNYSDYPNALECFELSLKQGEKMSDYYIGNIYAMGKTVPRDLQKAKLYLDKAVKNNIPEAMYQRGLIAIEEKETTKGLMLLDQSTKFYYKPAIKQLGVIYYQGEGIPKEIEKAVIYLKLGAEQNIQLSQYMLGLLYITGEGVIQDNHQAAKLLKKAIRGEDEAIAGKAQRIYQKYGLGEL